MIINKEKCPLCGNKESPTELMCDNCAKIYKISDFSGVVLHFSLANTEDEVDEIISALTVGEEEEEDTEFHYCSFRCLTEYLLDPTTNKFSDFDDRSLILITGPEGLNHLFFALGRCNYD